MFFFLLLFQLNVERVSGYSAVSDSLMAVLNAKVAEDSTAVTTCHALIRSLLSEGAPSDTINYYLQKSFRLARQLKNEGALANSYYLNGKFYISIFDFDAAMESFIKADNIYKKENLNREHGLTQLQFGVLLYTQQNYLAAINYFDNAYSVLKAYRDTFNSITCRYLVGLSLIECNKYKEAELILMEMLPEFARIGSVQRAMETRMGLARLYLKTQNYSTAELYADTALKYFQKIEFEGTADQSGKANCEMILGQVALAACNYETARTYLLDGLEHARLSKKFKQCVEIIESIIELNNHTGRYNENISRMEYLLALKDTLARTDHDRSIGTLQTRLRLEKQNSEIEILMREKERDKILRFSLIALAIALLVISIVWYQKNVLRKESNRKLDNLLLNILPETVAEELKLNGFVESHSFSNVTVLFIDIVAFTKLTERLTPSILVKELHTCFSSFDGIIKRHGLEKIKTIGDAYMCAGGVPVSNDSHALDAIHAAQDILAFMVEYNADKTSDYSVQLRIGIHTGPVVAGIVGINKFAYDIWGDTVNIAARIEQMGEPGKINISESTYHLVKDKFNCISRGKINAKYKGEINMYFVA